MSNVEEEVRETLLQQKVQEYMELKAKENPQTAPPVNIIEILKRQVEDELAVEEEVKVPETKEVKKSKK